MDPIQVLIIRRNQLIMQRETAANMPWAYASLNTEDYDRGIAAMDAAIDTLVAASVELWLEAL